MAEHFSSEQKQVFHRIVSLQGEIAETDIRESNCPLLLHQLNELEVLHERLLARIRQMKDLVHKAMS